jgi:hypothetical protein
MHPGHIDQLRFVTCMYQSALVRTEFVRDHREKVAFCQRSEREISVTQGELEGTSSEVDTRNLLQLVWGVERLCADVAQNQ